VSAALGSLTVLPRLIGVPSRLVAGAPVIAAVGATLRTLTVVVYSVKPPSLSRMRAFTVFVAGPSSNVHAVDVLAALEA
jgi:hypothetical protein